MNSLAFSILHDTPLWAVGLLLILVLVASIEAGYRIGLSQRKNWRNTEAGGGGIVQSTTLALLGLILAFTYGASVARNDAKKTAVINEANAISTAFNVADLIIEPERSALRAALAEYTKTRLAAADNRLSPDELVQAVKESIAALGEIWPIAHASVARGTPGPLQAQLIASTNEVIDMNTVRLAAVRDRLPSMVIWMQLFVASIALGISGFNTGLTGKMSRGRMFAFAAVLAAVMFVILDFDRGNSGFVQVSQVSLVETLQQMESELSAPR